MLLRYVHFDIHKFEFVVYSQKKWKNQPTFEIFWKYIENLSLLRCSLGWPLKMCKYQGQKRCLQRYWYSFSLPWRCKYFQNTLLTILGVKITIFITKWLFRGVNWIKCVKTVDFDHKKFGNIFWKYLHLHGSEKLYQNLCRHLFWPWYFTV